MRGTFLVVAFASCALLANAQHPVVQSIVDATSIDSMVWNLERLSGEQPVDVGAGAQTISSRHTLNSGNALASDWLQQRLTDLGYSPSVQVFSGGNGENLIAVKTGAVHPGRKVIICGHYDAMPAGPVDAPAADDDGSGTVAVLEAARLFAPLQFENTVVFALWDEEEQGKIGSAFFAAGAASNDDTLIAVINMDAISYDGDGDDLMRIHTKPIANSIALKDTAVMANTLYGIDLPIAINNPGAIYSDHASFWTEGYSAILVIEDFDNDGNPHYHSPTDRIAYIDLPYFRRLAQLSLATTAIMAVPFDPGSVAAEIPPTTTRASAFPVPTLRTATVVVENAEGKALDVQVIDAMGRALPVPVDHSNGAHTHAFTLDLGALPSGSYRALVRNNGRRIASLPVIKAP